MDRNVLMCIYRWMDRWIDMDYMDYLDYLEILGNDRYKSYTVARGILSHSSSRTVARSLCDSSGGKHFLTCSSKIPQLAQNYLDMVTLCRPLEMFIKPLYHKSCSFVYWSIIMLIHGNPFRVQYLNH